MTPPPAPEFCDEFLLATGGKLEILSDEEVFPDFWVDDPDLFMDCADMRDSELILDLFGCLDAPL